jgi:hypothetical protein
VQGYTSFVAYNGTAPFSEGYGAILALGQPESTEDVLTSFPMQAWFQNPNYDPTVCLSYYWNCDNYTNNTTCDNKTSQVIFGNSSCFDSSTSMGSTTSPYSWTIDITSYSFGTYTNDTGTAAFLYNTGPYISIE